ncbi:hypothetical protein ACFXA0_08055 [Streptomyces cyaneofuscatus]|uniref:hypothetical protein n=1 Tax=Streptomyces cyaneofuscatus TaxID=66883 RepID=UPI0036952DA9
MTELIGPAGALTTEVVLQLPGARRHCARVLADLRAGLTCVWLFPDAEVESGRADRAVDVVIHGLDDSVEVPRQETRPYAVPETAAPAAQEPREEHGAEGAPGLGGAGSAFDIDDGFGDWDPFGLTGRSGGAGSSGFPGGSGSFEVRSSGAAPPRPAEGPDAEVAVRFAETLSLHGDLVSELVAQAGRRTPVLVVRAWAEADLLAVSRLVRRFQAVVKEAGLKPGDRPRLLVAARLQDVEADTVGLLDRTVSRPHWWWGVWGHLDTATVVADAVPSVGAGHAHDRMTPGKLIRHALRCETVVQVAGPDMGLAVLLADTWNGKVKDLAPALRECCSGPAAEAVHGPATSGAAYAHLPEQGLREAWSAGLVESWEGQIRHSPRAGVAAHGGPELDKLVWQAQNRVLLPLIDDARLGFIELLPRIAVRGTARLVETYVRQSLRGANGSAADLASMELGELYAAAVHRDIELTGAQFRQLRTLRLARNKLAHRAPLDDALLPDLLDALSGY